MIATNIRKEARESLKGKWLKAVVMLFIEAVIIGIIWRIEGAIKDNSTIKTIIFIIKIIIQAPLALGLVYSFIKLKRNEEVHCFDFVKIGFENFSRSWALFLRTLQKMILPIIVILSAILLVIIFWGVGGAVGIAQDGAGNAMGILVLSVIVFVAAIAYAVVIGLKYVLATYIAYDNQDMTAKDIVKKSEELMIGHRGDFFVLLISFLGWIILCCIPFIMLIIGILPLLTGLLSILFWPIFFPFMMYQPNGAETLLPGLTEFTLVMIYGSLILIPFAVIGGLFLFAYIAMAKVCFYDDILQEKLEEK